MTNPHLQDQNARVDTVDALRLLVADLQALADRLGLKEHRRSLQQTLKATQERVSGPRAVVMLLAEHADLKRQFLERLLGGVVPVPNAVDGCTRLEYGAEPECTITMPQGLTAVLPLDQMEDFLTRRGAEIPQQATKAIRLPNSALARGLAVIDTPPIADGGTYKDAPAVCVLESAAEADAWVLVLSADHALSAASQSLLRCLPDGASRLEILVEGAESLNGEARLAARERLETTLRDACGITEPRLTLVASAATEGDEGSFWHGRFATFQSVMMLRGRERWREGTRAMVADALTEVAREIEFEQKSTGLGLRHARLRLGLKDLEGLRARFVALGQLDKERPREAAARPALLARPAGSSNRSELVAGDVPAEPAMDAPLQGSFRQITGESAGDGVPPEPMGKPTFVGFSGADTADLPADTSPRRGVSVSLSTDAARLLGRGAKLPENAGENDDKVTLPWRIAGFGIAAAFLCLMVWAVWPRLHVPGREPAAQWNYHPAASSDSGSAPPSTASSGATAAGPAANLPSPESSDAGPDVTGTETLDASPPLPGAMPAPGTTLRTPLPRPGVSVAQNRRARRRGHGFLGLGRVWHWIRHPAGGASHHDSE